MSIIQGNVKGGLVSEYSIDQSLRFNDNDSAYLSRTPSVAGNRRTWTFSTWVKRGNLGTNQSILPYVEVGNDFLGLRFNASNQLEYDVLWTGGTRKIVSTNNVFRDISAWYHIVFVIDTTNANDNQRIKCWINNKEVLFTNYTTGSGYVPQNTEMIVNSTNTHYIGRRTTGDHYFDGYLAETHFIDGQALTPDNFGEFDETYGHWKPIAYDGTYGTNGFYLDNSGLGTDVSGNGNNFTATNLATTDIVLDSPTNNFATFNPLTYAGSNQELTQGGLVLNGTNVGNGSKSCTIHFPFIGKWYCEFSDVSANFQFCGIEGVKGSAPAGGIIVIASNAPGNGVYFNGSMVSSFIPINTAIYGFAFDVDADIVYIYENGTLKYTQSNFASTLGAESYRAVFNTSSAAGVIRSNFGQDSSFAGNKTAQGFTDANGIGDFYYEPPAGYLALCSQNLPEPTVVPSENFNVVTYAGNGTSSRSINELEFQPDFIWFKSRSDAIHHRLFDLQRGVSHPLISSSTSGDTVTWTDDLQSFDSNGFTIGTGTGLNLNTTNYTMVAWNWKAGGTAVTNTDGSITSQVSANVDAGFSIVGYEGNTQSGATIGHGLNKTPELIIIKNRDQPDAWAVQPLSDGTKYLSLNSTAAQITASTWNSTNPTSSVFTVGTTSSVNALSENYIAYCFHSVEGYSKIGTYTGNGSTDGPFLYCGFRPKYVMIKCTSDGQTYHDWFITDTERDAYNIAGHSLIANEATAESASAYVDFVSNGFKIRANGGEFNTSGGTYLFMAFAEQPFKYTNAR